MELSAFRTGVTSLILETMARQLVPVALPELKAAMMHLVGRGKLFRPLLALATCRAVAGTDPQPFVPLVTPLELIHTFTLIHDDLPCMDDAALRRGVASVHLAHGEAVAVLAGDALANYALRLLAEEPVSISAEVRLWLISAATDATHAVVEGQVLDLQGEGRALELPELQRMHRLKTGALLGACCEIGALLGDWTPQQAGRMREFGVELGLAFQIRDDLLSVESDEAVMGKTLTTDADKEKSTYVRLLGLEGAHRELDQALAGLDAVLAGLDLAEPQLLASFIDWAGRRDR